MNQRYNIHRNLSLREALRIARHLGCRIMPVSCTDEIRIDPPNGGRPLRIKSTRKDSPAKLKSILRQLQ